MLTMTARTVAPANILGKYHFTKAVDIVDIKVERFVPAYNPQNEACEIRKVYMRKLSNDF